MNDKFIKLLGIGVSIAGIGLGIISNIVSEKQLDSKINNAVNEALKQQK
jgi:hypothetical protein